VSSAVPERHPDQDQLADLAAEVLPREVARSIEAHVMGCRLCEGLLADAERVRRLLFTEDPGPMPDAVWARLQTGLTAESGRRSRQAPAATPNWFDFDAAAAPGGTHTGTHAGASGTNGAYPRGGPSSADSTPYPTPSTPYAVPEPYPTGAYPTGAYPTGAYPTGAYPTGAYPTDGHPTDAYPTDGYPTDGYPAQQRQADPYATGAYPADPYGAYAAPEDADATRHFRAVDPNPGAAVAARLQQSRPAPAPVPLSLPPAPPPEMSFDEAPTAAWKAFLDEPEPAEPDLPPAPMRVGRAVRSTLRTRRDLREDRDAGRRPRSVVLASAAAAVVAVVGVGIGAFVVLRGHDGPVGPSDISVGGAKHSILVGSGREYTASTLATQVRALVGQVTRPSGSAPASASAPVTSPSRSTSGAASAPASASAPPASVAPKPGSGTVADPTQLRACLNGLMVREEPLVVDLARYQGVEAAVVVILNRTGGYDVWIVNRQCTLGAERPLGFKTVPAA